MKKALPCPFCGKEPLVSNGGTTIYGRFFWSVECQACDVWMQDKEVWLPDHSAQLDPAYPPGECIDRWNTRPPHQRGEEYPTTTPERTP